MRRGARMTMHSVQNLQIARDRRFFAISTAPGGAGRFIADNPPVDQGTRHYRNTLHVRDAALFNAADADAILRQHPRFSVLQAVQVGDDDDAAAND